MSGIHLLIGPFHPIKWLNEFIEEIDQNELTLEKKEDQSKRGSQQVLNVEDVSEGKMIDVMDFMSKWASAIVTKVDKNSFEVVVEGGLQLEIQKNESSEMIAPFQSRTGRWSPDKIQRLKNYIKEGEEEEKELVNVIMKKANKSKRHQNTVTTPTIEEPEKKEVRMFFTKFKLYSVCTYLTIAYDGLWR